MTDRDDLARLLRDLFWSDRPRMSYEGMADAIIAQGWMKRTWCEECEANVATNGEHHRVWCSQDEGETNE